MHSRENPFVLEIKETDERLFGNDVLKEKLCRVISRNAARQYTPHAAGGVKQLSHPLCEYGVKVNVATPTQRIQSAIPHHLTLTFCDPKSRRKL